MSSYKSSSCRTDTFICLFISFISFFFYVIDIDFSAHICPMIDEMKEVFVVLLCFRQIITGKNRSIADQPNVMLMEQLHTIRTVPISFVLVTRDVSRGMKHALVTNAVSRFCKQSQYRNDEPSISFHNNLHVQATIVYI